MAPRKTTQKGTVTQQILQSHAKEVSQIRSIAIKILKKIDKEIDSPEEDASENLLYERIFGAKSSLIDTLVTLTDLILRITPTEAHSKSVNNDSQILSDGDKKLLHAFLKRQKQDACKPSA